MANELKAVPTQSNQFSLTWRDATRGFVMAVLTGAIWALQEALSTPDGFNITTLKHSGVAGLVAGVSYLVKNFFTKPDTHTLLTNGYYIQIDQWSDVVTQFDGTGITPTAIGTFAQPNGLTKWDDGAEYYYSVSRSTPFTLKINGSLLSSQIFTGRPPIILRPV